MEGGGGSCVTDDWTLRAERRKKTTLDLFRITSLFNMSSNNVTQTYDQ